MNLPPTALRRLTLPAHMLLIWLSFHADTSHATGTCTDADHWQLVTTASTGQTYQRDVEASSIPMVMITTTFNANPDRIHALINDYDHFAEFIPNVAQSRVLTRESNAQWVFHRLHFPGPLADRIYVIKSIDIPCARKSVYRVEWQLSHRQFRGIDSRSGIWPEMFSGFWELRPADSADSTVARYAVHSDPGGLIPAWLVAHMTHRYLQRVIDAIRKRLLTTSG